MHEAGRGARAFEAPPVLGTFVVMAGSGQVVAVVDGATGSS